MGDCLEGLRVGTSCRYVTSRQDQLSFPSLGVAFLAGVQAGSVYLCRVAGKTV